jgi:hypothetical protein
MAFLYAFARGGAVLTFILLALGLLKQMVIMFGVLFALIKFAIVIVFVVVIVMIALAIFRDRSRRKHEAEEL